MDTDQLLDRVVQGESSAAAALLTRHEQRLRRMVSLRLDPRLAARVDPSDVVQDTLAEAHRRLIDYAADRRIPFYPWLRGIAWDKLVEMTRRHIMAQRRSVNREVTQLDLSGDSQMILIDRLMALDATPSEQMLRQEVQDRVQQAILQLSPRDREVIVLKHLEELSVPEIAAVLNVDQEAVYSRYRRAIQRIHRLLTSR
jgi:RNA polymerase sigma-70 factor (ECF subfamily)